ncbi:MAG: zinc-binding dehydrogenase [Actinophytocola sp.]|uniref:zinc-binding dehydrogenase n=1 Tax=Actinophytocola sp. TaxID=1872138 RepID=UPI0013254A19|nr:zinc-binding dehydrogenase [Actinophytocola sp.]MPZ80518.1 zinc-binding dehydrogenase [Actinophytocola sp.]
MHAIRQHEFGPPSTLRYEEVPDPVPAAEQVRIRVGAAGVHLLDTAIRSGVGGGPFPLPALPMTPGREVAGVVDALGDGVDPAWLGKRVVAYLNTQRGGYAELAVVAAAALHEVPAGVSDAAAVATIGTGRTAMAVLDDARITDSDVVLVPAAAGGIGAFVVQAARDIGAIVIGLAGPAKLDVVRGLGAELVFDYTSDGWPEEVRAALADRAVTVVLDGVGGKVGRHAMELLGVAGRLVMFGWSAGSPPELRAEDLYGRGLTVSVPIGQRIIAVPGALRALEERALAEVFAGRIVPLTHEAIPLAEAARAHTELENRGTVGKVVLVP